MSAPEKQGRPVKLDYALKILGENLQREEKNLIFWKNIIDSHESLGAPSGLAQGTIYTADPLALRQAKGSISSTENRIEELKKAMQLLSPTPQQKPEQ
jgi:hypothetical protein